MALKAAPLFSVRKGNLPVMQLENTQAQHRHLLVKENKKYKTEKEPFCSYLSGRVMPGRVGATVGRAGGFIIGGPGIMGMWPPMGGLLPGAGPTGIIPGGGGPIIGIMGGPPMWGAGIMPGRGGPGRLGVGGILAPAGGGAENGAGGVFP